MPAKNGTGRTTQTRSTPEDGDLVIREENRGGVVVYVLNTAPGPDQYVIRTCDEGVAQALTFAKLEHVRAWVINQGHDFVLLEDFRAGKSPEPPKFRAPKSRRPAADTNSTAARPRL